jgi:succinoglycan biosynthesis transport protein ExoP
MTPRLSSSGAPLSLPSESATLEVGDQVSAIWRMLMRRRKAMVAIFTGFVILVALGTFFWPKQYESEIKLIAGSPNGGSSDTTDTGPNSQLPVLNAFLIESGVQTAETYAELFEELPVAQRVIDQLQLKTSPDELLKHVTVRPITNTSILDLQVTWKDRATSAAIANAFGDAIVGRQRELVGSQARAAITTLQNQLPGAQVAMSDADTKLSSFEAKHKIADIGAQTQQTINALADLDAKVGQSQADQQQAQAQLDSAQSQLASASPSVPGTTTTAQNPVLVQLLEQAAQTDVQLRNAQQQYTDQHPTVIALKAQQAQIAQAIASQQRTIVASTDRIPNPLYNQLQQQAAQARSQVASDGAQIAALRHQRDAMTPLLQSLPGQTAQLADLQRGAKAAEEVYTALQDKFVNAQVASQTALSDVTVTQPATPEEAKPRPSVLLNTLIAMVFGFALAIVGAFVLEYFDSSIKDEHEVERELGLPPLSGIPMVRLRNGEVVENWVRSLATEGFLQLVTNLKYSTDERLSSVLVTSPAQGDGKSTIALNMAIALGELEGPVLVIDADLRRPSVHAKLHLPNERGLSDVLVGRATLASAVHENVHRGIDVLTSGAAAPNPIKLLESTRLETLLEDAAKKYKVVIIDAAALLGTLEAAVLARKVDGTVLVLSRGTTDLRDARRGVERLRRMGVRNVLGFVFNRVEPRAQDYALYELASGSDAEGNAPFITATS